MMIITEATMVITVIHRYVKMITTMMTEHDFKSAAFPASTS